VELERALQHVRDAIDSNHESQLGRGDYARLERRALIELLRSWESMDAELRAQRKSK